MACTCRPCLPAASFHSFIQFFAAPQEAHTRGQADRLGCRRSISQQHVRPHAAAFITPACGQNLCLSRRALPPFFLPLGDSEFKPNVSDTTPNTGSLRAAGFSTCSQWRAVRESKDPAGFEANGGGSSSAYLQRFALPVCEAPYFQGLLPRVPQPSRP